MSRKKKRKQRKSKRQNVEKFLSEAIMMLRQGNLNAAQYQVSRAQKFAGTDAEKAQVCAILTELQFRTAVKETAPEKRLAAFTEALKTAPHDMRLRFYQGIALLQNGKPAEAQKAFEQVAKTEPEREGLAFFQQLALLARKQAPPTPPQLLDTEANTLTLLQRLQRLPSPQLAQIAVETPVLGAPDMWNAFLRLRHDKDCTQLSVPEDLSIAGKVPVIQAIFEAYRGVAAMRAKDRETAMQHWQQALSQGFAPTCLSKNIGLSLRQQAGELAAAGQWKALANMAGRLPPTLDDATVRQLISLALFHSGYEQAQSNQWAQALDYWTRASDVQHNRYLAQNIALAHEQLNQLELAADAWREMVKRRPRSQKHPDYLTDKQVAAIWAHAADCYFQDFLDNEAVTCFRKAIEYDPQNLDIRFKLVSVYREKGVWNPEAIIRELKNILEVEPENIEALTQLAQEYDQDWRHDSLAIWKKIVALEPDNPEARDALANKYLDKIFPETAKFGTFGRKLPSYTQQMALIQEALDVVPDHAGLVLNLGALYMHARKKDLAREAFMRAYQLAPNNTAIAANVMQDLIKIGADDTLEDIIPQIRTIPGLLPAFWIDQGHDASGHPAWVKRFFDEAIQQLQYSPQGSLASVLVDIYLTLQEKGGDASLKKLYLQRIKDEVPQSGALEYIDGFTQYKRTGDVNRARRMLHKAKRLARAANDAALLKMIEGAEMILSGPPMGMLNKLLGDMDEELLEEFMEEMKGFR